MNYDFCGIWGKLRENFLRLNYPAFYQSLKNSGELVNYLENFQNTYSQRAETLTKNLQEKYGVDEDFFQHDSLSCILISAKIFLHVNSKLRAEIQK